MRRPRRRLKGLTLNRMIPNILTMLALCAGMTAMPGQRMRASATLVPRLIPKGRAS